MNPPYGAKQPAMRGQVWYVKMPEPKEGEKALENKRFLIVSNNKRNQSGINTVLAVPVSTTPNAPTLTENVVLGPDDKMTGRVLTGEIALIPKSRLLDQVGALSHATMGRVADGLRAALFLNDK